jgi:hypothetical protein
MNHLTNDLTIVKNYIQKYRFLIKDYELVKEKQHPTFKTVKAFCEYNHTDRKTFLKYYHRYKQSGEDIDLLPQRRGPRYKTRRTIPEIEEEVIRLRDQGNGRYEIAEILRLQMKRISSSGVYNILKRYNRNKLTPKVKEAKRKIIKTRAGELGHIDCHYLSKAIIEGENKRLYLVCVLDDCTRLAWTEVVEDIQSVTVMFAVLRCLNRLNTEYSIKFEEIITDNGSEFKSPDKKHHPFERLLEEMAIKHRYTRPYRPQTNGKVERFWKTIESDLLEETSFKDKTELEEELIRYMVYYNNYRPHGGIDGKVPKEFLKSLPNY